MKRVVMRMKSRYLFIFLHLLLPVFCLVSMEKQLGKHILYLKLDDGLEDYSIARWKVTHQSNTLCKSYGNQSQSNTVTFSNITRQEIALYDKALNTSISSKQGVKSFSDYFRNLSYDEKCLLTVAAGKWSEDGKTKKLNAKRLSCQLLQEWIEDSTIIKENIILKASFVEYKMTFDYLLAAIIEDNIRNNCCQKVASYSYNSEIKSNTLVKALPGGYFRFMPKIEKLKADFFNGKKDEKLFLYDKQYYLLHAYTQQKTNNVTIGFSGKKEGKDVFSSRVINIWQIDPVSFIKEISHIERINYVLFSPAGQWIAVSSQGGDFGKLTLTCLNSKAEDYLVTKDICSQFNTANIICFNNASTLLVVGQPNSIDLFDVETRLLVETFPIENKQSLTICFNKDDSRMICCLRPFGMHNPNQHTIVIWDTSCLDVITKLSENNFIGRDSSKAIITFDPVDDTIVSVLTDGIVSFFDICSGKYLSCIEESAEKGSEYYNNNLISFIPNSSLACVVMVTNAGRDSHIRVYNYKDGNLIGKISPDLVYIDGIGITDDLQHLVTTVCGNMVEKIQLYSDDEKKIYNVIKDNITLVDLYLLLQLQRAKRKKESAVLHCSEYEHVGDCIALDDEVKQLIKNYFL